MLSLICPWHCSHRGTETLGLLACLATSNFEHILVGSCRVTPAVQSRKCTRLQRAGSRTCLAGKAVAQPHLPMALLAQRHRDWGCLLVLPHHISNVTWKWGGSLPGSFRSLAPKMRTSADSWQPEGASLQSCCSASSAHGTVRTEEQRLGLLACLATSKFKRRCGVPRRAHPAALLRKCKRLPIGGSQKG